MNIAAILLSLLLGIPALGGGPKIVDTAAKFSVQLPEGFPAPKKEKTPVPSALGKLTMTSYSSVMTNRVCIIGYSSYPAAAFTNQTQQQMYDGARDGAVTNMKGTLLKEEDRDVDGKPGRSIWIEAKAGTEPMVARFDYVASKPRLIFFAMLAPTMEELASEEMTVFFNSFHFRK